MAKFGVGVELYFIWLKLLAFVWVVLTLFAMPVLLFNADGNSVNRYDPPEALKLLGQTTTTNMFYDSHMYVLAQHNSNLTMLKPHQLDDDNRWPLYFF